MSPSLASITFTTTTHSKDPATTFRLNNKYTTQLYQSLRNSIPGKYIKTQSISMNEEFDYLKGKQFSKGFKATNSVEVTVLNIDDLGVIISSAIHAGNLIESEKVKRKVNTGVSSLRFGITPEEKQKASNKALEKAVNNAMTRANIMAITAGVKLGSITKILDGGYKHFWPLPIYSDYHGRSSAIFSNGGGGIPTPIEGGEFKVTSEVQLKVAIEKNEEVEENEGNNEGI